MTAKQHLFPTRVITYFASPFCGRGTISWLKHEDRVSYLLGFTTEWLYNQRAGSLMYLHPVATARLPIFNDD